MTIKDPEKSSADKMDGHRIQNLPSLAETNVRDGDGAEHKEDGDTRQGKQPVEDGAAAAVVKVDIGQETEKKLQDDDRNGTSLLVNVCQELRSHAWDKC